MPPTPVTIANFLLPFSFWWLKFATLQHLLSASTDKTVRLWELGSANCVTVFPHSNFGRPTSLLNYCLISFRLYFWIWAHILKFTFAVTCVQFNPDNENRFISGSIDGKIRVWDIPRCSVVDWVDIRDIVTAICYRPDGKVFLSASIWSGFG